MVLITPRQWLQSIYRPFTCELDLMIPLNSEYSVIYRSHSGAQGLLADVSCVALVTFSSAVGTCVAPRHQDTRCPSHPAQPAAPKAWGNGELGASTRQDCQKTHGNWETSDKAKGLWALSYRKHRKAGERQQCWRWQERCWFQNEPLAEPCAMELLSSSKIYIWVLLQRWWIINVLFLYISLIYNTLCRSGCTFAGDFHLLLMFALIWNEMLASSYKMHS